MSNRTHRTGRIATTGCLLIVAACGGGGGGDGGGGNPPPALNIVTTTMADGVVGSLYVQGIFAIGGTGNKSYSVSAGTLPGGLAMDASTGQISGTPTGPAGTTTLTVSVADSGSPQQTDAQAYTFRVADPLVINVGVPPMATVGVPYSHTITASGGTPPYTISAGLPSGLSIGAGGVISGTPAADARSIFTGASVSDSAVPQQSAGANFMFRVLLQVATTSLPDGTGGIEYREWLEAYGGFSNLSWLVTGGSLPFGFPINGSILNGEVRFTPIASCSPTTSTFDVQVTDSDSPSQVAVGEDLTMTVAKGPLSVPPASLPVARVNQAYSAFIRPALGVAPYSFAVTAGSLPPGLSLMPSTGEITGTPTAAGIANFTVTVTDDCGTTAAGSFNLTVGGPPQGRNDSIATATAIGNGTFFASISPSGHPNTVFDPDEDFYSITTFAASTVTVDLEAQREGIDTVVEITNASGTRLNACTPPAFTSACMNDDEIPGSELDSFLEIRVNGPTTFYVRVLDWRGDARPDLTYTIEISGVN